ncbi:MAG: hypothetical protein PHV34_08705 [Verrucomicrobiae bacterium]|nr:hypothetical protein [Verrucomicrobiae bacterium]
MNEPLNQKMDQMLRAYAKKRREQGGDPPPLHSAMRNLLQNEVTKVYASRTNERPERSGIWAWLATRSAIMGTVCAAVLVVGFAFLQIYMQATQEAAKRQTEGEFAASRAKIRPAGVRSEPMNVKSAETALSRSEGKVVAGQKQADASVAAESVAPACIGEDRRLKKEDARGAIFGEAKERVDEKPQSIVSSADLDAMSGGVPANSPRKARLMAREALADNKGFATPVVMPAEDASAVAFQNAMPLRSRSVPQPGVLDSFHVEQTGNRILIREPDGSVYVGDLGEFTPDMLQGLPPQVMEMISNAQARSNAMVEQLNRQTANMQRGMERQQSQNEAQGMSFRARGTNRSLNQSVDFFGNIMPLTNGSWQNQSVTPGVRGNSRIPTQLINQGVRIQGQAVVGGTNTIELNAVPVAPK